MRYRGLMIDTARTWLPMSKIHKLIKGMQSVKMNALHIHLSDSDSFPVELSKYHQIPDAAAYSNSQIYTKQQIRELVNEAQRRGVIVIPELDMPSHARSWANSPELNQLNSCHDAPGNQWGSYCLQPPCGQLDASLNLTYEVISSVLDDLQEVFTQGYFHFGGDEINQNCWDKRPAIKEWMRTNNISDYFHLQSYFS